MSSPNQSFFSSLLVGLEHLTQAQLQNGLVDLKANFLKLFDPGTRAVAVLGSARAGVLRGIVDSDFDRIVKVGLP
jgi:hypothetical protein